MRQSAGRSAAKKVSTRQRPSTADIQARIDALEGELREALARETAIAEVLGVINSAPGDLTPVFDEILEKAHQLCAVAHGGLLLYDGERFRAVATRGYAEAFAERIRDGFDGSENPVTRPLLDGARFTHFPDLTEIDHPLPQAAATLGSVRTALFVPLRRDDKLLGLISAARHEIRLFSEKEIALIENFAAQAVIAMENARLVTETREALEQQTATAEVLGVINSSPGDLAPVFDAMLERAMRLCDAAFGGLTSYDGERFATLATRGLSPELSKIFSEPFVPHPGSFHYRLAHGESLVHGDHLANPSLQSGQPQTRGAVEMGGARTGLVIALQKKNRLLGSFWFFRQEVRPFTDKQIALLQNFAAQAVIAMENARLITETREALEQQTATAEVLQVINSSPGDLGPVFDAMLERATRLCEASSGLMWTTTGERFQAVATRGMSTEFVEFLRDPDNQPRMVASDLPIGRVVRGEATVHVLDLAADEVTHQPPTLRKLQELGGFRTVLALPLRNDDALLGAFVIGRREVRPFTDKQIALLQDFAAQAVIAMENARLITETREALERQTATAEVLQVINASPGDLTPVFNAILEKAHTVCGATVGTLFLYDGEKVRAVATRGYPEEVADVLRRGISPPPALLAGERLIHVSDVSQGGGGTVGQLISQRGGVRTNLIVPLRKDRTFRGMISCNRKEVRPYTDQEIALIESFAAQAVIAMENARLLGQLRERTDDLQEALERQTGISDVLKVISQSTFDLQSVLDTLSETAGRLCQAELAFMTRREGDGYRFVTAIGSTASTKVDAVRLKETVLDRRAFVAGRQTITGRVVATGQVVQIEDIASDPEYTLGELVTVGKIRTLLGVPLMRAGGVVGTLNLGRQRVEPFTEKQIELVRTFADQAVIAMENARLITETREALEQQTATVEVLGVINSSPGDLAPVFGAILEKAHRLCDAAQGTLLLYDGEKFRAVAGHGYVEALTDRLRQPYELGLNNPIRPLLGGARVVQIPDLADIDDPVAQSVTKLGGYRTTLFVPLRKDGSLLGVITAARTEIRPFIDKQIALLESFAAQAVIAMENARLITETREALEQQTATAEVLGVINASPGNLGRVFEAMLDKAMRLCEAAFGGLWTYDGGNFRSAAMSGVPEPFAEFNANNPPVFGPGSGPARLVEGEPFNHVVDLTASEAYLTGEPNRKALVDLGGARTALAVPLRKDDALVGLIMIYRQEVRPFSDKQIALLQNFAAQAVIAMENARLLGDLRERTADLQQSLEYQTATSDVLKVISRSDADLETVLENLVATVTRLCQADHGHLFRRHDEYHHLIASSGLPAEYRDYLKAHPFVPDRGTLSGRVALERRIVQIEDAASDPEYARADFQQLGNLRTGLGVPLLRDETLLGIFALYRSHVERFTDKQIALAATFADQAVIAIENARLLGELRDRQAELRATFDNMADGVAMFDQELRLAAWNRNFQELLQLDDALLTERPMFDDYIRHLTERGEFGDTTPEAEIARLRSRLSDHYSFERTRPDGTVIEVRNNPMPDGGTVVIYSDITERKRSEAEIRAARDAAEAAYRDLKAAQANLVQVQKMAALGQLTAGIAHEIKNPLNFVNNFAGLSVELLDELKETAASALSALDEDKRAEVDETVELLTSNLEKIAEHGKRADNIVKSMLEHSRGVTGERREVDLNGLIDEALNLAYHGARAQDQNFNITLERALDPQLQRIELAPQEMTRVFLNLFGNGFYAASKRARENGEASFRPTLTVATRELGQVVEVRVRDNGTGIAPAIRDKLFQPFVTTKPTGEGTGLGLSISYEIVTQQHGGTIEVDSEPGAYTEFTVRLPRRSNGGAETRA